MSPVRRRAVRAGKGKGLLFLLLLAVLAGLAAAWVFLRPQAIELPEPQQPTATTLRDCAAEDVLSLTVSGPYDAPYTLYRDAAGVWQMEGQAGFVFRPSMLSDMVNNAALIVTEDTVGDLNEHPEWQLLNFGLSEGCTRVSVAYADGTALAFRIGSSVPAEIPAYYFYLEGDSRVFTIAPDVYECYANTRMALHDVRDPALNGDLIDRIAFAGEAPFTLEKRADGWYLTAPFVYPLADAAMDTLLGKLGGLRFAQFVARAEDADLAALGLSPPVRTLTLDIAPSIVTGYDASGAVTGQTALDGYRLIFDLGHAESEVVFYCLYRGEVVKATVFSAGFLLTQGYDSLLLTAPFNAPTNDITRLTWEEGGQTRAYDIRLQERVLANNQFETDENGNILYDLAVRRDGEQVDSDAFLTAYARLLDLRTADRLPADYRLPDAAPALCVTVTRSGAARRVAFYPLDALHLAVAVDGVALFQVESDWAAGVEWP